MNPLLPDNLSGYVPFSILNASQLSTLANHCLRLYARRGQVVIGPGSPQEQAYFLMGGTIRVEGSGERITAAFPHALQRKYQAPASLVAETDCSLFQIDRELLDRVVCSAQVIRYLELDIAYQRQYDGVAEWIRQLLRSNLFHKVSPLNLQKIIAHIVPMEVRQGQVILRQGETGDACYFIRDGVASVTRLMEEEKRPVVLAEIGATQCFGEEALLHETVRNATVTMISDGLLMRLDKRDFVQLLREPPVDMLASADLDMALQTGAILLDVRTEAEFACARPAQGWSMPLDLLRVKSKLLDAYQSYVICCDTDRRSRAAVFLLGQLGFRARALAGGLDGLSAEQKRKLFSA